jgi:hypothetical protein
MVGGVRGRLGGMVWGVVLMMGVVPGIGRRLLTGFLISTYGVCVTAVRAVAWGLYVADCVVWVYAVCLVLGGAGVCNARHAAGSASVILLHLEVFILPSCGPVRPCLWLGGVEGWGLRRGALGGMWAV